ANGDWFAALDLWRDMTLQYSTRPECWVRYGNALRAVGLRDDCIAAFRRAVALEPAFSIGWLNLADLKTFRFDAKDIEAMEAQLANQELSMDSRSNLHFAIGKAYGDANFFEKSFSNFAKGNAIRRL